MARGDTVQVTIRTPVGTERFDIDARTIGATVEVEVPKDRELYLEVSERSKVGKAIRTFRFLKTEVLAVAEQKRDAE